MHAGAEPDEQKHDHIIQNHYFLIRLRNHFNHNVRLYNPTSLRKPSIVFVFMIEASKEKNIIICLIDMKIIINFQTLSISVSLSSDQFFAEKKGSDQFENYKENCARFYFHTITF
jgi:hypothetical protein